MHLPFSEQLLLSLLILLSAGVFLRNLYEKVRQIVQGPADRVRTDRPWWRLSRMIREVLLQTRVIGQRPVVGALHAVVFLGFLLFGLETLEHFLRAFGLSFLEPVLGPAMPAFRALMTVIAILVATAILGLAFRRFVLVKTSPDPRSWTSAVVALFIFLLMLTYLNAVSAGPIAPRANWWLHALIILVFPHLILRSKHFHILMAPLSLFFRTERLGDYTPLDLEAIAEADIDDVSLGLEKVSNVPWKMRMDFLTCVECRRCTDNCPAALAGNELDPRAFVLSGRRAVKANRGDDEVGGNIVSEAALGFCATCGACENGCPVGVEHLQLIVGAKRAQALSTGRGVVASDYFRSIETYGNPFKVPRSDRQKLICDLALPRFRGTEGEWLLWLGCVWGYNPELRSAVKAFKDVLAAAGINWGVLDEEPCCGHHSRRQGEESQFQDLARRSIEVLREKGVRRIVTPCPHCLHTLRHEHLQLAGSNGCRDNAPFPLQIVHYSELLNGLIGRGSLQLKTNGTRRQVTYHDPCYLARYEGISNAPRAVLAAAGATIHELPHRRESTLCCGGGAAGFVRELESGQRLDRVRRSEIVESGATVLVTACPECRMMLSAAVDETKDLAEVVAESVQAGHAEARV
ncbi:MAG: 4Fe-4S dicluster domain-containing protein [Acidobacteria bacterium]|nr:MAG: 4Fe-4S dicluster domain-containing protein [Acidobacteriota bacterium]